MTYGFLLESIWHPPLAFEETAANKLPSELELQALWFGGAFGRDFRTTTGKNVRIVQFGEWNRGAGPDFIQTAVEIDGELRTGPLELDPVAADWEAHGHAENPAFREVVLHVVFQSDARRIYTRTSDHREIAQVVITEMQLSDALSRPQREVAIAHPGRCVAPLKGLPAGAIERLLGEAAVFRAESKAARWLRTADAHGRDAALFQSTAETLGYRGNSLAMKLLAQRASLALLKAEGEAAESILFGTAGFLSADQHELAPPDTKDYLRVLWDIWWKIRARFETAGDRRIPWKTSGQRPANHPHRRVGALGALIKVWPQYRKLALARPFQVKPLIDFLQELDHEFWTHRHTLESSASAQRIALFGKSQALELIANHLAPLAMHENGMSYKSYHKLRNSAANEKVKRCALRLFGSQKAAEPWVRRVCHHQALLQVYQDFCLEDSSDCANCPFPEQLAQWR
ncbi:MAG: DUF2851 family protein [Verrucomicrobiota bacterium]